MGEITTADLDSRIQQAAPASGEATPVAPPTTDQQKHADELGAAGDPLDQRIADAEDYKPEGEKDESDADRKELADQLPPVNPLQKRLENAEDAE